jgi:hypothetical protein
MSQVFKKTNSQIYATKQIVSSSALNILLEGGSRSGKSFLIMRAIVIRASKCRSDHIICRETFNAAKRSIWQKTMPDVMRICFPNLPVKFNRTDYYMSLPNGSRVFIAGLDDRDKLERLLGTEYSTLWINEANQVAYPAITKLKTRLAEKNILRKLTFYDQNPTKTTSAIYQVFHDKVDPIDGEMLADPDNYLHVKMNPHGNIENLDPEYIKMLESLPEKERKRFLDGDYDDSNSGSAVYAFDKDAHVSEDAKRLPGTDLVGTDFNIDYNSDILASQHGNGIYVWDEIQIAGDTFRKVNELKLKGVTGATIIADSTGVNRRTSGQSDFNILKDAGFNVVKTLNPSVIDKINNLNRCFTLGLIKINPRCKKLIRDLIQLKWDKQGQLDQKTDPSLSHLVDCLAYLCWKLYPLRQDISDYHIHSTRR